MIYPEELKGLKQVTARVKSCEIKFDDDNLANPLVIVMTLEIESGEIFFILSIESLPALLMLLEIYNYKNIVGSYCQLWYESYRNFKYIAHAINPTEIFMELNKS